MKKPIKSILAVLLAMAIAGSATACGSGKDESSATATAGSTPTEKAGSVTGNENNGSNLVTTGGGFYETPMDLNGRVIKFITPWAWQWKLGDVEENTSNEIRAIVEVLHEIEADYNCTIEVIDSNMDTYLEDFATAKAAGDIIGDFYDYAPVTHPMTEMIKNGYFMPVDDLETVKINEYPWHLFTAFSVYEGKTYGIGYQFIQSGDILRDMVMFNRDIAEKYKLGNFYEMVREGTFTFDKFKEICENVKERSGGRVIPVVSARNEQWFGIPLVIANGGNFFTSNDGILSYTGNTDPVKQALQYFSDLCSNGLAKTRVDGTPIFKNGEALFLFNQYWAVRDHFSDMYEDFGIIPPPIGPSGSDYTSTLNDGRIFSIFENAKNPEEIGAVITAFANRAYNNDWQDKELQYALRDEASVQMIEIMLDRQVIDYSTVVPNAGNILDMLKNIATGVETPQEGLDRIDNIMQTAIQEYYAD